MSLVKRNIMANLIGNGWVTFLSFAFVPLYISFMGIESYALVGFYATLQAVLLLLDMGMAATVSRELARLSAHKESNQKARNLVRTLEIVYFLIGIMVFFIVLILAPWISQKWLGESQLSSHTIEQAIILMGAVVAIRMISGFYYGGLQGLQQQVLLNKIKVFIGTLQSVGVVLLLWLVSPTIELFFYWQAVVGFFGLGLLIMAVWKTLPSGQGAYYQSCCFHSVWKFAMSMSIISFLSVILVQMDKIVLSKILTLEVFAHYILASSVAVGLYTIISPIFQAVYPRLSQLVAISNETEIKLLYHKSCQLMTILIMPLAIVIASFSFPILRIWLQDDEIATHAAPVLSLLIIGTALNGIMNIPYALQLAYGWTKLAIYFDVIAVCLLVPALFFLTATYGVVGAASVWIILNIMYIIFPLRIMHKKLLKGEMGQWFLFDFIIPSGVSLLIVMLFWWFMPVTLGALASIAWIFFTFIIALLCSLISATYLRSEVFNLGIMFLEKRKVLS